jgi:predicted Zn-dependent protease
MNELKAALEKHPEAYHLYQPYAKAATALNKKSEAFRALAELQYAQGNLHQAVDYLQQALNTPGLPPYDRLSLQARQEMVKTEVVQREQSVSKSAESRD